MATMGTEPGTTSGTTPRTRPRRRPVAALPLSTPAAGLAPRPPLYWRRWAFAASALFNLVFVYFLFHTRRLTYAAITRPAHTPSTAEVIAGWVIGAAFYGALILATLASVGVATGLAQRRFHLLLHIIFGANLFLTLFMGGLEAVYSARIGYGYSEPMTWLLIGALQTIVTLSAYRSAPPPRLRLVAPAVEVTLRLRAGARAFRAAYHLPLEAAPTMEIMETRALETAGIAGAVS
jgi:hypothetical protein